MEEAKIINKEDKEYYDGRLWGVGLWPGAGYYLSVFKAYGDSAEEVLERVVAYCEVHAINLLNSADEMMEMIHDDIYTDDLVKYLEDNPEATEEDFIEEYLGYIYVDGTMYGASQPYYVEGNNLQIWEIRDEEVEKEGLNEDKDTDLNMQPTSVKEFQELVCKLSNINNYKQIIRIPNGIDTSKIKYMDSLFEGCTKLIAIPEIDTQNVVSMAHMFEECESLKEIPLLNTINVMNMNSMFKCCINLKVVPELNTSNVTDMRSMFYRCENLKTIPKLDTCNVTNMDDTFRFCKSLKEIPLLDTNNVNSMNSLFSHCINLKTIPELDTRNVRDMSWMFKNCNNLQMIPKLNTTSIKQINNIIEGCNNLSDEAKQNIEQMIGKK